LVWEPTDTDNPSEPVIEIPGFVFSLDEIDAHIDFQSRLSEARHYVLMQE